MDFAFIIMGAEFCPDREQAGFATENCLAAMYGVSSLEEACRLAAQLAEDGITCIELCGAFGPEGAQAVIEATGGAILVGYVTHLPSQDELFAQTFANK